MNVVHTKRAHIFEDFLQVHFQELTFGVKGHPYILRLLMRPGQLFSRKSVLCLSDTKHRIRLHLLLDHRLSISVNLIGEMRFPAYCNLHRVENQGGWVFGPMLMSHLCFLFGDSFVLYLDVYFGS